MPKKVFSCAGCGISFQVWVYPSKPDPRFCSRQCWLQLHNNPERNKDAARKGSAKQRAQQVDTGEQKTYRKFYGRHEHRVVMEKVLGRSLRSDEIVHHIDGDKRNNDPSNLQLVTRAEHARIHFAPKKRVFEHACCPMCRDTFELSPTQRLSRRRGYTVYCSSKCYQGGRVANSNQTYA